MRLVILLPAVLLLTPLTTALAQGSLPLTGARLRVHQHLPPINSAVVTVGTLNAISGDTLILLPEGSSSLFRIPFTTVSRLDVSRGRYSHLGRGAAMGLVIGAAVGAGIGFADGDGSCPVATVGGAGPSSAGGGFSLCFAATREAKAGVGAVLGGLVGAGTGAAIGSQKVDRWRTVPLPGTERD